MTSAMTSSPAAAQARKLAGERRRDGTNGGHQRVESDAANSPNINGRRWRRGRSGGDLRLDDDGGAPAVYSNDGGADEVGDDLTITTAAFPSDDDDRSGGGAWLDE
uniref:Retrotransposon protein, putative, unclassified n=1 Tax=Oryza sativa subsp. japonica TaxID=39947 RepID=Q5W7B3_ORYSJ|nr:hypothetical protein [Oryza sativa Japonica Group]